MRMASNKFNILSSSNLIDNLEEISTVVSGGASVFKGEVGSSSGVIKGGIKDKKLVVSGVNREQDQFVGKENRSGIEFIGGTICFSFFSDKTIDI